jgi:hypothetical protein
MMHYIQYHRDEVPLSESKKISDVYAGLLP